MTHCNIYPADWRNDKPLHTTFNAATRQCEGRVWLGFMPVTTNRFAALNPALSRRCARCGLAALPIP